MGTDKMPTNQGQALSPMTTRQLHPLRDVEQQAQGYLRCYVVWGPTEGSGCGPREDILFTHSKVCDLDVSFGIQHHIIQLEVPGR